MTVKVVGVGHMRVRMLQRPMPMYVAVLAGRHRVVRMIVVPVVVAVRMFMLHRRMRVLVAVRFGQVQQHAGQHQRAEHL